MRRPAVPSPVIVRRPAAPAPKREPAEMHDAHLANAIAKESNGGDQVRLKALLAEQAKRSG